LGVYFTTLFEILHLFSFVCFLIFRSVFPWFLLSFCAGGNSLNRNGDFDVKVGFAEPRRDGGSNAKIGNILEFGKHGQPPRPFLKPAKIASRDACIERMRRVFEEEVGR
jgi:hypothetical protein